MKFKQTVFAACFVAAVVAVATPQPYLGQQNIAIYEDLHLQKRGWREFTVRDVIFRGNDHALQVFIGVVCQLEKIAEMIMSIGVPFSAAQCQAVFTMIAHASYEKFVGKKSKAAAGVDDDEDEEESNTAVAGADNYEEQGEGSAEKAEVGFTIKKIEHYCDESMKLVGQALSVACANVENATSPTEEASLVEGSNLRPSVSYQNSYYDSDGEADYDSESEADKDSESEADYDSESEMDNEDAQKISARQEEEDFTKLNTPDNSLASPKSSTSSKASRGRRFFGRKSPKTQSEANYDLDKDAQNYPVSSEDKVVTALNTPDGSVKSSTSSKDSRGRRILGRIRQSFKRSPKTADKIALVKRGFFGLKDLPAEAMRKALIGIIDFVTSKSVVDASKKGFKGALFVIKPAVYAAAKTILYLGKNVFLHKDVTDHARSRFRSA